MEEPKLWTSQSGISEHRKAARAHKPDNLAENARCSFHGLADPLVDLVLNQLIAAGVGPPFVWLHHATMAIDRLGQE